MNHAVPGGRRSAARASIFVLSVLVAACGSSSEVDGGGAPGGGSSDGIAPLPPTSTMPATGCTDPAAATTERVARLGDGELLEMIVSFESRSALDDTGLDALKALGVRGLVLDRLPIVGVLANRAQIALIEKLPGVRSVRWNAPLSYEDDVARYLTSVDQARAAPELRNAAGEPITGKGVTILVNDSGIDATHPDLRYGSKVLRNALGHTNLRGVLEEEMLPFTPTEGLPNTDLLGSHGTHVAGIAAGDGSASGGRFAGAASGATLAGYGSGATLLVLDTLGGFDYGLKLLDEAPELNLRIVTNSFGNTGDVGTCFDPDDPTNIATKALADRGVVVVFSAGNSGSGPGTITGNFKKAPWVIVAGNGEKSGLLAPSSSRGRVLGGEYTVEIDGETLLVEDRPTVVTPGTDYISARAIAADPFTPLDLSDDFAVGDIPPELLPYYTMKTGTSMAAPHLAGLTALLLEANPALTWREVKQIFKTTATNMPGYEQWETGAGFANAEAALAMALALRNDYGSTNHTQRGHFSLVPYGSSTTTQHSISFLPAGPVSEESFEVGDDALMVIAQWRQPLGSPCTCAVVLIDPEGRSYGSGIALPVLGANVAAASTTPIAGTWKVTVRGIGSVSGVPLDPLGVTNGIAGPGTAEVTVTQYGAGPLQGLADVAGRSDERRLQFAVRKRLVDGLPGGFAPDALLTRAQLAEYLMAWGVRQTRAHDGSRRYGDIPGFADHVHAAAEAITRSGQLILDRSAESLPLLPMTGAGFSPSASVSREQVAYALVQAMGYQARAESHQAALTAPDAEGNRVPVVDAADVDPALLGHVQEALDLGLIDAEIANGEARLRPRQPVTRAQYAETAARAYAVLIAPAG